MDPLNQQPLTRRERRALARAQRKQQDAGVDRKRVAKRLVTWLIVLVLLAGSVWGIITLSKSAPKVLDPVSATDWTQGPRTAKVTLIEYSDFECPYCALIQPVLKSLLEKNKDKFLFVYRNFPLKTTHPFAVQAARFAEAAGKQGKFWEYHDLLFEKQSEWSAEKDPRSKFIDYGRSLSLNADQLAVDADSQAVKDAVEAQYQSALRAGVDSTPTFFLNGTKLPDLQNITDLQTRVEDAIAANP